MDKEQLLAWNRQIIEEFRANGGKVGGPFEGAPIVLLHTTGAKSGLDRISPLVAHVDGGRVYVFASKAGAPTNPDWYNNLLADPNVTVEYGTETYPAKAVVLDPAARDEIYDIHAARFPNFREYQENTTRRIPVIELVR
ncbi:MAG: nitroreductase family deazaflavin-dependent oxidoreductase [Chloroflexota bacterium]